MFGLANKGIKKVSDEQRVDSDGTRYRATRWTGPGHTFEINQDRYGYHARADGNSRTTQANMDEGGVIGWLIKLFGG